MRKIHLDTQPEKPMLSVYPGAASGFLLILVAMFRSLMASFAVPGLFRKGIRSSGWQRRLAASQREGRWEKATCDDGIFLGS